MQRTGEGRHVMPSPLVSAGVEEVMSPCRAGGLARRERGARRADGARGAGAGDATHIVHAVMGFPIVMEQFTSCDRFAVRAGTL